MVDHEGIRQLISSIFDDVDALEMTEAPGRVTWEPPPLREESPTSVNEADIDLALSAASALIHDNKVLSAKLAGYETALTSVLKEVKKTRAEADCLPVAQVQLKQYKFCLDDAAGRREELYRQNAQSSARIAELTSIMQESLDCMGDVQLEALIEGMAKENHALWRMVKMAQKAADAPVAPPPVFRWPLNLKAREGRRQRPKAAPMPPSSETVAETTPVEREEPRAKPVDAADAVDDTVDVADAVAVADAVHVADTVDLTLGTDVTQDSGAGETEEATERSQSIIDEV